MRYQNWQMYVAEVGGLHERLLGGPRAGALAPPRRDARSPRAQRSWHQFVVRDPNIRTVRKSNFEYARDLIGVDTAQNGPMKFQM